MSSAELRPSSVTTDIPEYPSIEVTNQLRAYFMNNAAILLAYYGSALALIEHASAPANNTSPDLIPSAVLWTSSAVTLLINHLLERKNANKKIDRQKA